MSIVRSLLLQLAGVAVAGAAVAQSQSPILGEETTQVSEHVWAIMGWPNIGIVVGPRAVLVVDTGLGPQNGATVAGVVAKLAPNRTIYLTTTHFHPEHTSGDGGFSSGTILVRNAVQQSEMEEHGLELIQIFAGRNDQQRQLLNHVRPRRPDVIFDTEYRIDLGGGVLVRLLWFGAAHTKGDELIFVDPDRTLISGDIVQNKVVPNIPGDGGTPTSWIAVLTRVQALRARHVLPDHSPPGNGSLVGQEKAFIVKLRTRALRLKHDGVSAEDAGQRLTSEFKSQYSSWGIGSVAGFVKSIYAE